jgi:Citrate lyase beta subunit
VSLSCRSYLFVPGDRPERFQKAAASGADCVVIDLEDAVSPPNKARARESACKWLMDGRPAAVRVNGVDTPWFAADLAMCRRAGAPSIMIPKAQRATDLMCIHKAVGAALLPIIESAQGVAMARRLAGVPGVQRLVLGSVDLRLDLGISGDDSSLSAYSQELVLASRLAGIEAPVAGVTLQVADIAVVEQDARCSRRAGFGAKLCIHPAQVNAVNACFQPSQDELAWARSVVAAAAASGNGAFQMNGQMVDAPVIDRATRLLMSQTGTRSLSMISMNPYFRSFP